MVIGSLVEDNDAPKAIEEKEKKNEENTPKKIMLLIPCWSREMIIVRNNGLAFPLIKNKYIYTKSKTQK